MISNKDYATILKCAEQYRNELENTNLLFVYQNRITKKYEYMESTFLDVNFKHLTGIIYPFKNDGEDQNDLTDGAKHFFNLAINKRLNINKCNYKEDGTTALKLEVLQMIINIKRNARMIGDYNHSRMHIMADKMCGAISATLAFRKDARFGYCPSSTIKDDIRNLVTQYHPIHAVFQKGIDDEKYTKKCYCSKKYDESLLSKEIKNKLITEYQSGNE